MATFTIDLLTGNVYLFTGDFTGSGSTPTSGSTYPQVNAYTSLPSAASSTGEVYLVRNSEGTTVLTRKPAGLYYSTGTVWRYLGDTPNAFLSDNFQILDSNDNTKGFMFQTSGITTGTYPTLTIQNSDGTLAYLTDVDGKVDTSVFDDYTGTTAPATFLSIADFNIYTGTTTQKIDVVTGATGYLGTFTASGNLEDSGYAISDLTGGTEYTFVGSGGTQVFESGTTVTIYSAPTTGSTATWGGITGTLSAQTDLWNVLTTMSGETATKLDTTVFNTYTGTTASDEIFLTHTGGTELNSIAPVVIEWDSEEVSGSSFSWTGSSEIQILETSNYEISYNIPFNILDSGDLIIGANVILNNDTIIDVTAAASMATRIYAAGSVGLPTVVVSLTANDVLNLATFRTSQLGSVISSMSGSILIKRKNTLQ